MSATERVAAIVAALTMTVSAANAQIPMVGDGVSIDCMSCYVTTWPPVQRHAATGNADLDKAVAICDAHAAAPNQVYATLPPQDVPNFQSGWEDCRAIIARWEETDAARRAREAEAKDAQDRAFLKQFLRSKAETRP